MSSDVIDTPCSQSVFLCLRVCMCVRLHTLIYTKRKVLLTPRLGWSPLERHNYWEYNQFHLWWENGPPTSLPHWGGEKEEEVRNKELIFSLHIMQMSANSRGGGWSDSLRPPLRDFAERESAVKQTRSWIACFLLCGLLQWVTSLKSNQKNAFSHRSLRWKMNASSLFFVLWMEI